MKPAGIEPATFRFVAQHLNHCATAVPTIAVLLQILYLVVEMYAFAVTIDALYRQRCRKQQYVQTEHPPNHINKM